MNPVVFQVERAQPPARVQVLIRALLWIALAPIVTSSLYWILYLLLPATAAAMISQRGGARYLAESESAVKVLRWLAGFFAYLWLLNDEFPTGPSVQFALAPGGTPTVTSSLVRLLTTLPALLLLALMSIAAAVIWVLGALTILIARKLPKVFADFLAMTVRLELRILAYHLSLVDAYPSPSEAAMHAEPRVSA
jgi:hypothetical protein